MLTVEVQLTYRYLLCCHQSVGALSNPWVTSLLGTTGDQSLQDTHTAVSPPQYSHNHSSHEKHKFLQPIYGMSSFRC